MSKEERHLWRLALVLALSECGFCAPRDAFVFYSEWCYCLL